MAASMSAGFAMTGRTSSRVPSAAPVRRMSRRVASIKAQDLPSVTQGGEERHHVFDLFRSQDRLVAPCGADAVQAVRPIIAWHDAVRIKLSAVDQPEPDLSLGQPGTDAGKAGGQIALKPLLREWAGMTEQTQPALAAGDDDAASPRVARSAGAGQRRGDRIADHSIRKQSQCQHDIDHPADHPKTSAVMVSNHASA